MLQKSSGVLGRSLGFCLFGLACWIQSLSAQSVDIGNYELVGQKRIGRTLFEYQLRARATNRHAVPVSVAAALSLIPGTPGTIVDGNLKFAGIRPGESAHSDDVFGLRLDRSLTFNSANLQWTVTTSTVPNFVVSQFNTLSQTRFGRTSFEYVVSASLLNFTGTNVFLRATATPVSGSGLVIPDPVLLFQDAPANGNRTSLDTFSVRLDRNLPLDLTQIQWSFENAESCLRPVALSINTVSVPEGDSGTNIVNLEATIPSPLCVDAAFAIESVPAVQPEPGGDYEPIPYTRFVIPAGSTSTVVPVRIRGDQDYESPEQLLLRIWPLENVTSLFQFAIVVIQNDDPAPVLTIRPSSVSEGNVTSRPLRFEVGLSRAIATPLYFKVRTDSTGHTATPSGDYVPLNEHWVTLEAGHTNTSVTVTLIPELLVESDETFALVAYDSDPPYIAPAQGTGTILDDDGPGRVVHHFSILPSTHRAIHGVPIPVTLQAVRQDGQVVPDFASPVELAAISTNPPATGTSFPNGTWNTGAALFTIGYEVTPQRALSVKELKCLGCTTVDIWDSLGKRIASAAVPYSESLWMTGRLTRDVVLSPGQRYRVSGYFTQGHRLRTDVTAFTFPDGTVNGMHYQFGDVFPNVNFAPYGVSVGMNYDTDFLTFPQVASPTAIQLVDGQWSGPVILAGKGNAKLYAIDRDGLSGQSETISVTFENDLSVRMVSLTAQPRVGDPMDYEITVENLGEATATGGAVACVLPPLVAVESVSGSIASWTGTQNRADLSLANLSPGASAVVVVRGRVQGDGFLNASAVATMAAIDDFPQNNEATATIRVPAPCEMRVASFGTTGVGTANHAASVSFEAAPLAVSQDNVMLSEFFETQSFSRNLAALETIAPRFAAIAGDIATGEIFAFGDEAGPKSALGGFCNRLYEVTPEKPVAARRMIVLSDSIPLRRGGLFAGMGACVLYSHPQCYWVDLQRGRVGMLSGEYSIAGSRVGSEGVWGILESWQGSLRAVFPKNSTTIVRLNLDTREETVVRTFSNLGIMPAIAASPQLDRWYFRQMSSSQFGTVNHGSQLLGYAAATFENVCLSLTNDLSLRLSRGNTNVLLGDDIEIDAAIAHAGAGVATGLQITLQFPQNVELTGVDAPASIAENLPTTARILVPNMTGVGNRTVRLRFRQLQTGVSPVIATLRQTPVETYLSNNEDSLHWSGILPTLSLTGESAPEGNANRNTFATLTLSRPVKVPVTVQYAWQEYLFVPSAATPGVDFVAGTGEVIIPAGTSSTNIFTTLLGDDVWEADEDIQFHIVSVTNVSVPSPDVSVAIRNDDPVPVIHLETISVVEPASGQAQREIRFRLSNPGYQAISVNYQTRAGTATSQDFQAQSGTVNFPAGNILQNFQVTILGDDQIEGDEVFYLDLQSFFPLNDVHNPVIIQDQDNLPGVPYQMRISGLTSSFRNGQSQPFTAVVRDWFSNAVPTYARTGALTLTAISTNLMEFQNEYLLDSINSGHWTVGYEFSVAIASRVQKVRSFNGQSVSFWDSSGNLLRKIELGTTGGEWREQPVSPELVLQPNTRYRVSCYIPFANYSYYFIPDGSDPLSSGGTIHSQHQIQDVDGYPSGAGYHGVYWPIHFTMDQGSKTAMGVSPGTVDFVNGTASANLNASGTGTNVFVQIDDGNGIIGTSGPHAITPPAGMGILARLVPWEERPESFAKPASVARSHPRRMLLRWNAPPARNWRVLSSRDLIHWTEEPEAPVLDSEGTWFWTVPVDTEARFFKAAEK